MIKDQETIRKTREAILDLVRTLGETVPQDEAERCIERFEKQVKFSDPEFRRLYPRAHIAEFPMLDLRLRDLRNSGCTAGNIPGAYFSLCNLERQAFACSALDGASFSMSILKNTRFDAAILNGADFMFADCEGADFSGAKLKFTCFRYANLRGAKFHTCTLYQCDFRGADLTGATFDGAQAVSCRVAGAVGQDFGIQPPWLDSVTEDFVG